MSISFSSANSNQALILETFGLPTFASKEKLYTPIPCCQEAKVFQLGRSDVSFETPEFSTLDEYKIHVIGSVSYSIDAKTRSGILKAYRSLVKNKKSFYDSFKSPFKQYQALEIGAEEGIKTILSDLIVYQMEYMTFEDVVSIDLVFIDNIFERAKKTLKEYYVQLKSINFKEVIQQSERRLELAENISTVQDESADADTESLHDDTEVNVEVTVVETTSTEDEVEITENVILVADSDVVESAPPDVDVEITEEVILVADTDVVESAPPDVDVEITEDVILVEDVDVVESAPPDVDVEITEEVVLVEDVDVVESAPGGFSFEVTVDGGVDGDVLTLNGAGVEANMDAEVECETFIETVIQSGEVDFESDDYELDAEGNKVFKTIRITELTIPSEDEVIDEESELHTFIIRVIPEASTVIKKRITTTEIIIDGTPVVAPEQPDVGVRTVIYAGDSSSSDDEETTVVVTKEVEGIDLEAVLDGIEVEGGSITTTTTTTRTVTIQGDVDDFESATTTTTTTIDGGVDYEISAIPEILDTIERSADVEVELEIPDIPEIPECESESSTTVTTFTIEGSAVTIEVPESESTTTTTITTAIEDGLEFEVPEVDSSTKVTTYTIEESTDAPEEDLTTATFATCITTTIEDEAEIPEAEAVVEVESSPVMFEMPEIDSSTTVTTYTIEESADAPEEDSTTATFATYITTTIEDEAEIPEAEAVVEVESSPVMFEMPEIDSSTTVTTYTIEESADAPEEDSTTATFATYITTTIEDEAEIPEAEAVVEVKSAPVMFEIPEIDSSTTVTTYTIEESADAPEEDSTTAIFATYITTTIEDEAEIPEVEAVVDVESAPAIFELDYPSVHSMPEMQGMSETDNESSSTRSTTTTIRTVHTSFSVVPDVPDIPNVETDGDIIVSMQVSDVECAPEVDVEAVTRTTTTTSEVQDDGCEVIEIVEVQEGDEGMSETDNESSSTRSTTTTIRTVHTSFSVVPDIPDIPNVETDGDIIVSMQVSDVECAPEVDVETVTRTTTTTSEVQDGGCEVIEIVEVQEGDEGSEIVEYETITTEVVVDADGNEQEVSSVVSSEAFDASLDGQITTETYTTERQSSHTITTNIVTTRTTLNSDGEVISTETIEGDVDVDIDVGGAASTDGTVEVTSTTYTVGLDGSLIPTDDMLETVDESGEESTTFTHSVSVVNGEVVCDESSGFTITESAE